MDWDDYYLPSLTTRYTTLSSQINGGNGGTLTGSVTDYSYGFELDVPAGAYSGTQEMKIMVPGNVIPVYQLLPHGATFQEDVTVTLDYSYWLDQERYVDGDTLEVFYMNQITEEIENLSPRVTFIADEDDATIEFDTSHFSKWIIERQNV